ncbi:hypothetical protein CBM2598_U10067 [Cupriavidus taiwanensis]|nr:hypothetical protein CBM2598_U10067 [Cupriavidus taiwanensis]
MPKPVRRANLAGARELLGAAPAVTAPPDDSGLAMPITSSAGIAAHRCSSCAGPAFVDRHRNESSHETPLDRQLSGDRKRTVVPGVSGRLLAHSQHPDGLKLPRSSGMPGSASRHRSSNIPGLC